MISLAFDAFFLDASNKNESGKCFLGRQYYFCLGFLLVCISADCACTFSYPKMA